MPFYDLDLEQNKNEMTAILNNKVMSKKQVKKSYSAPACMIIQVNEATYLMETSFPSQHKPGHHGTGPSGAKAATVWQEEEEDNAENTSPWED